MPSPPQPSPPIPAKHAPANRRGAGIQNAVTPPQPIPAQAGIQSSPSKPPQAGTGLRARVLTALVVGLPALAGILLLPPLGLQLLIGLIIVLAAWEWAQLAGLAGASRYAFAALLLPALPAIALLLPALPITQLLAPALAWWLLALILVAAFPALSRYWSPRPVALLIGALVLVSAWAAFTSLKQLPDYQYLVCLLLLLVWAADIGAYFAGRAFGRAKLLPAVSPGKTWAGLGGGLLAATALALLLPVAAPWFGLAPPAYAAGPGFLAFCALVALVSVLGDLCVSMFKRRRRLKDSGGLLPGHGGALDRIDSLLAATPAFVYGLRCLYGAYP